MAAFRISPEAEAELDDIWLYLARESGSIDIANRMVDTLTDRFWRLALNPYIGRTRSHDLRPGLRSLAVGNYVILYRIEQGDTVLILHVMHGRRDLEGLLGEGD